MTICLALFGILIKFLILWEILNKDLHWLNSIWRYFHEISYLIFQACAKARESLAYQSALTMANSAKLFLPENSWKTHQELTWKIQLEVALNEYLVKIMKKLKKYLKNVLNMLPIYFKRWRLMSTVLLYYWKKCSMRLLLVLDLKSFLFLEFQYQWNLHEKR